MKSSFGSATYTENSFTSRVYRGDYHQAASFPIALQIVNNRDDIIEMLYDKLQIGLEHTSYFTS